MINENKILSKKYVIQTLKGVYEDGGMQAIEEVFKNILQNNTIRSKKLVTTLWPVAYKLDTCESDCFEDLDKKKIWECKCNGEHVSVLLNENEYTIGNS